MTTGSLHAGHRKRIRQRYLEHGADSLRDHEFLELLLFYALPRVNTNETAHQLLNTFGSIPAVLEAETAELMKIRGIGENGAAFLHLLAELRRVYDDFAGSSVPLKGYDSICSWFISYFEENSTDLCVLVSLDGMMRTTGRISFTRDSLLEGQVKLKRLAELLLKNSTDSILLGINHTTGIVLPEDGDYKTARIIADSFAPIGIALADCVICSGGKALSLRKNGAFAFPEVI